MFEFQKPNLPDIGTVLICDKKVPLFCDYKNSIETVSVPVLPESMRYHLDLQICHVGEGTFLCAPEVYEYYEEKLFPYGGRVICGDKRVGGTYGDDCAYNILVLGKYAFHNTKFTPETAKKYFEENGVTLVHVNQGYTKCATAPVRENAVITADPSIKNAMEILGIECLLIDWQGVELQGFSYGFFGGACGRISKNEFYISGSLKNHPSKDKIAGFLAKHNMNLLQAGDEVPFDFGSLIMI